MRNIRPLTRVHRKKLPTLPPSLKSNIPQDDPSKHQGRIRTQPFVDGQFATYIYASIPISALREMIDSVIIEVRSICKDLEVFALLERPKDEEETGSVLDADRRVAVVDGLHLSLSRPIYLRSHQRDLVARTVKDIARQTAR